MAPCQSEVSTSLQGPWETLDSRAFEMPAFPLPCLSLTFDLFPQPRTKLMVQPCQSAVRENTPGRKETLKWNVPLCNVGGWSCRYPTPIIQRKNARKQELTTVNLEANFPSVIYKLFWLIWFGFMTGSHIAQVGLQHWIAEDGLNFSSFFICL